MKMYFTSVSDSKHLDFLLENNCCNILISFLEKTKIKKLIDLHNPDINIFIDSGAFSAFTRGIHIDIDEYIEFINLVHDNVELYASLDVIPSSDSIESVKSSTIETWENYLYMRERLIDKDKLVVTFHYGEDYSDLKKILNYEDEYGKIKYLALGGIAKMPIANRGVFIDTVYKIIKECGRTDIKIHLCGVTDIEICKEYGGTSTDSTTWVRAAAFGELCTSYGRLVVSETRGLSNKHLYNNPISIQEDIIKEIESYGIPFEDLVKDTKSRELFNIMYFYKNTKDIPGANYNKVCAEKVSLW